MCERCTAEVEETGKSQLSVYQKNHKDTIRQNRKKLCDELSEWFYDFKKNFHCVSCGEDHPAALTFHHRDPSQKKDDIAHMVTGAYSKKKILAEIAKCDVLCMNCHKKLHYLDGTYSSEAALSRNKKEKLENSNDPTEGYHQRHREQIFQQKRKICKERAAWFRKYKESLTCSFCNLRDADCLEFHHTNEKEDNVGTMVGKAYSIEKILDEVSRCIVLCSNCHRIHHYNERLIQKEI